jgi:pyrimidine operon attenuation protein/uracil phosphoribosyltransferase
MKTRLILSADSLFSAISQIAREIIARNEDLGSLKIVGIRTRGVYLAKRIAGEIERERGFRPPLGVVDITLYRDDLSRKSQWPRVELTDIRFPIDDKTVVLVDDVIYTGSTCRAAMEALMDFGRPSSIQLAVLVDRGHRELPIQPDYVGVRLDTSPAERVLVLLEEIDGKDAVIVESE